MKELSIEEKARAYDEIIKKTNKMHHENCEACQMCIEELIPELKESIEERIRKAMDEILEIQRVKDILEDYGLTRKAMLSLCPISKKLNTK